MRAQLLGGAEEVGCDYEMSFEGVCFLWEVNLDGFLRLGDVYAVADGRCGWEFGPDERELDAVGWLARLASHNTYVYE